MKQKLEKYCMKKELISLYADIENTDKFLTGYINSVDDFGVVVNHITPHGTYDGYVYISMDDIFCLEMHSKYIEKIKKLMAKNYQENHKKLEIDNNQSLFMNYLIFAKKNHMLISWQICGEQYAMSTGFIEEIENEIIKISKITEFGEKDGETFVKLDCINSCQCDTTDEQLLMELLK